MDEFDFIEKLAGLQWLRTEEECDDLRQVIAEVERRTFARCAEICRGRAVYSVDAYSQKYRALTADECIAAIEAEAGKK